jgi:adenosylhomocysteine nucleosidase
VRADIGIIGAMEGEVNAIIAALEDRREEIIGGIKFHTGTMFGKNIVVSRCGIGKVFAAMCAEAMIIRYSPRLIVNTGVGGAIDRSLRPLDMVFATRLVQHDMDTSPLGDPKGLISGINRIYFDTDARAVDILSASAAAIGVRYMTGVVASGDRFIALSEDKERIASDFGGAACEMEGAAIAHVAFVNETPCAVVRAISDSADGDASMDYMSFLGRAEEISTKLTLDLIENY